MLKYCVETAQCYFNGFVKTEIQHTNQEKSRTHTREQVILLKTLSKQPNAISMGLSKQKFSIQTRRNLEHICCLKHCQNSAMLFQWVCQNRNPVLLIATKATHTRKQVLLLKTLSKQPNAISMGLSKQKFSPIDSYKKQHIPGNKYYCLKHCQNSAMLFQWVCQNRNPVLLIATKSNTYQEASIIA